MARSFEYRIVNRHGDVLDLSNPRYMADLAGVKRSYTLPQRVEAGGHVLMGDGHVRNRKISLKFDRAVATIDEGYDLLNTLASFFRMSDAPFYCENLSRDTRIKVYGDFKPKHVQGLEYIVFKDSIIELDLVDSVWEGITEETLGPVTMSDGDILCLNTSSFTVPTWAEDIFPVIEIEGLADSDDIFSLETGRMEVDSDSTAFVVFRSILVSEATFANGKVITLDSTDGKAYIDGNPNQGMVTFGYPLKFDRRNLYLRYNSQGGLGSVVVTIRYRVRTLYG